MRALYRYLLTSTAAITNTFDIKGCFREFKMPPPIENAGDCEIRGVIRFVNAKGEKAGDIHRQI